MNTNLKARFEEILEGMVDIAPYKIHEHMKPYILEACQEVYDMALHDRWISVDAEPNIDSYYKLAMNDDVYLDVFKYRPKGIDGNSASYFRSVNDNSTLGIWEVSHYSEFNTDPPEWTGLLPQPPVANKP